MILRKIISFSLILIFPSAYAIDPDTSFNRQFRQEIGGWIAADATYSIYLPDGRTLWLFGDTFLGEVNEDSSIAPGSVMIRNSAVIQDGDDLQTLYGGTSGNPDDFIPAEYPDSLWYWPEHGVVESDTLRIFLAKFRHSSGGPAGFNFEHAGNDIASFTYPGLQFINTVSIEASASNDVLYGDRLLEDEGFIYIYGRRNDDPEINIPYPHVARVAKGELMKQDWEYFDGSGWSTDPGATKRINSFQVSQQYSVTKHMGKYILLTQDVWMSPKIFTFTSDSPVGPWGNKKLIYETPETSGDTWTYNAYAHPQFDRDGELLVSYNVNGNFWSIFDNVEVYRPRFIRIPYMNMDYAFWPTHTSKPSIQNSCEISIFPNPAESRATIRMKTDVAFSGNAELRDIYGRVLNYTTLKLNPGVNTFHVEMADFPQGIYFFTINSAKGQQTLEIIKK